MTDKLPIQIEVYSTPGLGKTHFCFKGVPDPMVIDLSPTKESYANAVMYGMTDQYKSCPSIDCIWDAIHDGIGFGTARTICFDSSFYLQDIASDAWINEENVRRKSDDKKPLNSVYPISRYGDVRKKVDDIFAYILSCGINVVCTSQLKSEYNGNKKTSKLNKYFKRIDELSMECLIDNICKATDMDKDVFVL